MFSQKWMCILPLLALGWPAKAAQPARHAQTEQMPQGMVIVRDGDTGALRAPTPAEVRSLHARGKQSAARASTAPTPKIEIGPGGRRSVKLDERHLVYSVVTRGAGGKLTERCVHGADAATHAAGESVGHAAAESASTQTGESRHARR